MEEEKKLSQDLIEYRLSNIETTLSKMESLLASNKMQNRDINDLKEKAKGFERRLKKLEETPIKTKADKWNAAIDTILKLALSACAGVILARIGLK